MFSSSSFRAASRAAATVSSGITSTRAFSATPRSALARMAMIGRLTAEPELVNSASGRVYARYSIAVNHGSGDNKSTSFFNVTSFDDRIKDLLLSLPKGSLLHVDAEARMSQFQTEDGTNRTKLNLVQRSFEILSTPRPREEAPAPEAPEGHQ